MKKIFTIGHSSYNSEFFISLLNRYKINCIADVRSVPYSHHTPQYNMNDLKASLKSEDIIYMFFGRELGARREERELYTPEGYLDFEKVSKNSAFRSAVERIQRGIDKGINIALMCTEKNPIDCHRCIMVARQFHENKYKVVNILANGSLHSQEDIEQRLLDLYFPDRIQPNLFEIDETINELDLIANAYRLRNREIGYYLNRRENVAY